MNPQPVLAAEPAGHAAETLDDAAFSAALASAEPAHRALAGRMLGNAEDAHDALQDAWLRAWRHRGSVETAAALHGWLRQIVARECLRALRVRALRSWLPFVGGQQGHGVEEPQEPAAGPDRTAANAQIWRKARGIVNKLSPQQRLVWGLRFDEGWTVPEIAVATGLSTETVKTHLSRALTHVQRRMGVDHGL